MIYLFGIASIVFIVVAFWIWKHKKWSNIKKAGISIILAASLLAAVYATFGLILVYSDHATYYTNGKNLGEIDLENVISRAKEGVYKVDGPYYGNSKQEIGIHPPGIKELDERFGEDYRFFSVTYFYNEKVYFSTEYEKDGTKIVFINEDRLDALAPFKPEDLPPDEWIIEKFRLIFAITETESGDYLARLKDSASKGKESYGKIISTDEIDFQAVYTNLKEESYISGISQTSGGGSFKETFYNNGKKIGVIDFTVPNVRIIFQDKGREYRLQIDRLGGVAPEIKLGTGEEIPENEYRNTFREMFVNIGLMPEKVDEFEFEYMRSVW